MRVQKVLCELNSGDELDAWIHAAKNKAARDKQLPFVIDVEIYEYLGEWVTIREVHGGRDVDGHAHVVIQTRMGDTTTICSSELSIRKPRKQNIKLEK